MKRRFIVREFKNGVKHFWDTENNRCIHHSKVEKLIPAAEFDILYTDFNRVDEPSQSANDNEMPKLIDVLNEVVCAYAPHVTIAEILGTLELCKSRLLQTL